MRIDRIETFGNEWVAFVRVRTDDGAEGWGQVAPYNADVTAEVLHRQVAPHVMGMDALDPGALATRVLDAEHKFPGSYVCRALAGVDTALWDMRGRIEGKGVSELLGHPMRPIDAYASSMRRDIRPDDEARRLAELRERSGFTAFKIRVGRECGHDQDEWPGRTDAVVPAVRAAVGDDARLLVDANSCYTPARAVEVGLPCVPHSANLSLVTVFALHLLAAVPNSGPYVEYSIEGRDYYPWQDGLFTPPLEVVDGRVTAPEGPGWGVEISPEWLAGAEHRATAA